MTRPIAGYWHTTLIVAMVAAWAVVGFLLIHQQPTEVIRQYQRQHIYAWGIVSEGLLLGAVLMGFRRRSWADVRCFLDPGPVNGRRWLRFILAALLAAVVWSVLGALISKLQFLRPSPEDVRRLMVFFPRSTGDKLLWILLSVSAGICEEMVYRGYLFQQFLAATKNRSISLVGQAMLYSCAHAALPWQIVVVVALLGVLFGVLSVTQKSLIPAMLLHVAMDIVPIFKT